MLKLYFAPGSCSLASHVALEETGAPFEAKRVDLTQSEQHAPDFLAVNPKARVPALVTPRGVLTESAAILSWIADSYPAAGLWPGDPWDRAQAQSLLAWLSGTVHATGFAGVFRPGRFTDDPAAQEAIRADSRKRVGAHFEDIEARIGGRDWMFERFGVADLYVLVFRRWGARMGLDMGAYPNMVALADRIAARPAAASVMAREGIRIDS